MEIGVKCPLVDVVIGGHSHSFLYTGDYPGNLAHFTDYDIHNFNSDRKNVDTETAIGPYPTIVTKENGVKVPVVQSYAYTKYLGNLRLSV